MARSYRPRNSAVTKELGIETLYIEPGSPWENGFAESIHSRFRNEFLATEVFENLAAARKLTAAWKEDYNHHRPHSSALTQPLLS